jgi:hypothetical protein
MEICTCADRTPAFAIVPYTTLPGMIGIGSTLPRKAERDITAESQCIPLRVTVASDVTARAREVAALLRQTAHGRSGDKDNVFVRAF